MRIYVIQVTPGTETKVRASLEQDDITAYVPRRELIIRRGGGWSNAVSVLFPSYVFLECDYSPEIHHIVKSEAFVLKWLGKPTPIELHEEPFMRLMINDGEDIAPSKAVITDTGITITDGWLAGKEQYISGFNVRKKRALLSVPLGGKLHRTSVGAEFINTYEPEAGRSRSPLSCS